MERYEQQNAGQDLGAAARSGAEAAKGSMNDLAQKGQEAASKLSNALNTANIAARTVLCLSAFHAMCPGIRTVRYRRLAGLTCWPVRRQLVNSRTV